MRKLPRLAAAGLVVIAGIALYNHIATTGQQVFEKAKASVSPLEGGPFGGPPTLYTHLAQVERIHGSDWDRYTVGYSARIFLSEEAIDQLETDGSICIQSVVVQLPETDTSDLDRRMHACNPTSSIAITAY